MPTFKKYYERHGTRRPFPSLYEAVKLYGAENVYFEKPQYVDAGRCPWCGNIVENKRRKYCSEECSKMFARKTVWQRKRDAYSLRILYRDRFICQDCGEEHAYINEYGIRIPVDDGNLNVHHIKLVNDGGGDEQENLITLCKKCHKARHKKQEEKYHA